MEPNKIYRLTQEDMDVMSAAANNPNVFFDHFFLREGSDRAFNLDWNFTDKGRWQVDACMAAQTFIVVVAGVGTGKSLWAITSAAYFSLMMPDFRFLNIAKDANQAKVTYDLLIEQMDGTIFQKMVTGYPQRPYPQITIEYMRGKEHVKSILSFFGLGDSGDATNVFSKRYDWINVEEAGLIDNLAEVVTNLSTRLTGATAKGRTYMGRMSLISNAWPNPELWRMFDTAAVNNEDGLAINLETRDNMSVTEDQIRRSLALTPDADYDRFMTGKRPENSGRYYMSRDIVKGENLVLDAILKKAYAAKDETFGIKFHQHLGIYQYNMPPQKGRVYFVLGDPGTGAAPFRNAPVIMVWDVTEFSMEVDENYKSRAGAHADMVAFWWGNGYGSIMPYVYKLLDWTDKYKALYTGSDSTGTQKFMSEIVNLQYIAGQNKSIAGIGAEDFSGSKHYAMLIALRLSLESAMLQWPKSVVGVSSQLGAYDPLLDIGKASKLAQDIVAAMAMSAFEIRSQFNIVAQETAPQPVDSPIFADLRRNLRRGSNRRESSPR